MNTFLSFSIRALLPEHEILIYILIFINVAHKRPLIFITLGSQRPVETIIASNHMKHWENPIKVKP